MSKLTRDSFYSISGSIITSLAGFIALRVFSIYLDSSEFTASLYVIALLSASTVAEAGLARSITLSLATKANPDTKVTLAKAGFVLLTATYMLAAIVIGLILLNSNADINVIVIVMSASYVVLGGAISSMRASLEGIAKFKESNFARVTAILLGLTASAGGAYWTNSIEGIVLGMIIGRISEIALLGKFAKAGIYIKSKFTINDIKALILQANASKWLILCAVIGAMITNLDRYIAIQMLSTSESSAYQMSIEIISRAWIIPIGISGVIMQREAMLGQGQDAHQLRELRNLELGNFFIGSGIALAIIILWKLGLPGRIFGSPPEVTSFITYTWPMAYGYLACCLAQINVSIITARGGARILFWIYLIEITIYTIIAFSWTKAWGLSGLVYAWTARMTIDYILTRVKRGLRSKNGYEQ